MRKKGPKKGKEQVIDQVSKFTDDAGVAIKFLDLQCLSQSFSVIFTLYF